MRCTVRTLLPVCLVLSAAPLAAQQAKPGARTKEHHGDMAAVHCGAGLVELRDHGMDAIPAHMGLPTPAIVLHHRKELQLTAAQIQKLQALNDTDAQKCVQHMEAAIKANGAADAVLEQPNPDINAYDRNLREGTSQLVQAKELIARARIASRALLTDAQWAELQRLMHTRPKS